MTTATATETEAAALFDVDAAHYHGHDQRPWPYLLVTREIRDDAKIRADVGRRGHQ